MIDSQVLLTFALKGLLLGLIVLSCTVCLQHTPDAMDTCANIGD